MRFSLTALEPIDADAVLPLADAKVQLRVDGDDDDPLIQALTLSAIDWVERYAGVALCRRQFRWVGEGFPATMRLPMRPVVSVDTVAYLDSAGAEQSLVAPAWRVSGDAVVAGPGVSWPSTLSGAGAASVTFTAGYGDVLAEAPALHSAVRMLLGDLYKFRESTLVGATSVEVPFGVINLCSSYRQVAL